MDTIQIVMVAIIAVALVSMILLLFAGVKANKVTTSSNNSKMEAKPAGQIAQPTVQPTLVAPAVQAEPVNLVAPVVEPAPVNSATQPTVQQVPVAPVAEPVVQAASVQTETQVTTSQGEVFGENFVPTQNVSYTISANGVIKPGMYKLQAAGGDQIRINLYGIDIPYGAETELALIEGDVFIAKSDIRMNRI